MNKIENTPTDYSLCPYCGSSIYDRGNSLHAWHIEYLCGCRIWGAIDTKTHGDGAVLDVICNRENNVIIKHIYEGLVYSENCDSDFSNAPSAYESTAFSVSDLDTYSHKKLYSEIEHLIIAWSIDGTKTAGHLTRQIMDLIKTI